jgi:hypothetical protein
MENEYIGCKIVNIRRGKGNRNHIIYANLVNAKGETMISADLNYIRDALYVRIPIERKDKV